MDLRGGIRNLYRNSKAAVWRINAMMLRDASTSVSNLHFRTASAWAEAPEHYAP